MNTFFLHTLSQEITNSAIIACISIAIHLYGIIVLKNRKEATLEFLDVFLRHN